MTRIGTTDCFTSAGYWPGWCDDEPNNEGGSETCTKQRDGTYTCLIDSHCNADLGPQVVCQKRTVPAPLGSCKSLS